MKTRTNSKISKMATVYAIGAALLCGAARAEEPVGEVAELEETEECFVSGEFSLKFDSKYLSYGFVDNNEPILTPDASLTFFDWVWIGAYAIFDVTPYGKRAGYTNREWKAIEFHPNAGLSHSFSSEDFEWLPTTVEISLGYDYEYHPRVCTGDEPRGGDTQYYTLEVTLPDLWLEPYFLYERDFMRDEGTYLQLEIGHTFALIDGEGEEDDPVLSLKPSIAQGWGNSRRNVAYVDDCNYDGLLDTLVKLDLTWTVNENMSVGCYVGYSDFLLDRGIRHSAREYEATGDLDRSWNFIGGVAVTASF